MTTCFVSREEKKRILDSDRKLKVFSRKEMRSGRESSKARKESQGNAIFPVETDGWMIGRCTNERGSGGTDRQASKYTGEQADEQSRPIEAAAGRLHSNELATLRRTPEDLYPKLARRGAVRHGMARFGAIRFDSTRLSAVLGTNHVTLLYANLLLDIARADFACLPLSLIIFILSLELFNFILLLYI